VPTKQSPVNFCSLLKQEALVYRWLGLPLEVGGEWVLRSSLPGAQQQLKLDQQLQTRKNHRYIKFKPS
jgi:hypothetical protein